MLDFKEEKWKTLLDDKYEISSYGRVKRLYKHNYRILTPFRKGNIMQVKLSLGDKGKDYNIARLVAEHFIRPLKQNEVVHHKNLVISDNNIDNLEIMTRSKAGKITGPLSRQKTICLLNDDGDITKIFKGTRKASKELFISRQTVSDYCNNKTKNKMINIVWADDLILED